LTNTLAWIAGDEHEIELVGGEEFRQFTADARRRAGDECPIVHDEGTIAAINKPAKGEDRCWILDSRCWPLVITGNASDNGA
jgi:hypothetical protein